MLFFAFLAYFQLLFIQLSIKQHDLFELNLHTFWLKIRKPNKAPAVGLHSRHAPRFYTIITNVSLSNSENKIVCYNVVNAITNAKMRG